MRTLLFAASLFALLAAATRAQTPAPGLLFYVSGDNGTTADRAAPGTAEPNFSTEVTKIPDGARGAALQCGDLQRLAWWAPGNIYAQRGTLAFFWRSRYPTGPTEFPIFRVGYSDHSSWDMVWLRLDYNGHGFDAFVTDASLARIRVSTTVAPFPKPEAWTHLALAWDETSGLRLYVNGRLAGRNDTTATLDAGLDQFGPHSRIISPYQVQSDYNFTRGGDIDEIRIYDHALADAAVAALARGAEPATAPYPPRSLTDPIVRSGWEMRYGFNRPQDPPPLLPDGKHVAIRKVEIHDAFDMKRWWWKATDGIRETTWPGVYNRSRLPGRNDYFQLPDWDCYVESGRAITFALPNEPWNHLEISGSAWGRMELLQPGAALENASDAPVAALLFSRPKGQEKTAHALATRSGGLIRFTNGEPEEPIGELSAYHVAAGTEPAGGTKLVFRVGAGSVSAELPAIEALLQFVRNRYPQDQRHFLYAHPPGAREDDFVQGFQPVLPVTHVLIPNTWDKLTDGLDGIALDLPPVRATSGQGGQISLNFQIKDPLWPARNLFDFTCRVKAGEAKTLWLDLRDRLLPPGKSLYLTVASDGGGVALVGAELRLVFKPRSAARAEHELDRFTQARDSYAMLVEEHPRGPRFNLWNRFEADLSDLLRVNPDHVLGRQYAAAGMGGARVPFVQPAPPDGVPLWAFRQVELLGRIKEFINWYIDHRQSPYGDFGGGISDDTDFTNLFPGVALMGSNPEKIRDSLRALLDAAYRNRMFTRGLSTIQTDELHSYEEGINCLAQNLILDYASPRQIERAMETARGVESITGVNAAGHRHIRSSYFSGSRLAAEEPWGRVKPYSYLVCQVPQLVVDYNGNPTARKFMLELADGLLAHRNPAIAGRMGGLPSAIRFTDDAELAATRGMLPWHLFWGAWKWTADSRYLAPLLDNPGATLSSVSANTLDLLSLRTTRNARIDPAAPAERVETPPADGRAPSPAASFRVSSTGHLAWQTTGDKRHLATLYATQIAVCAALEFINTEGSLWIDRVGVPTTDIQRARLGGVALVRNALYPGHTVSWGFAAPATDQSVALLLPDATPPAFKVIACNVEAFPVVATMTGWNVDPGTWEITQGIDTDDDDVAEATSLRMAAFERTRSLEFTLPPRATTILTLRLKTPAAPYWSRPDLGLDRSDVTETPTGLRVRIHSLGSVPAPPSTLVLRTADGKTLASATVPALEAPRDLHPRIVEVSLTLPQGTPPRGSLLEIDPDRRLVEITTLNNVVRL